MNYNEDERQNYMEISNSGKGHQSRERPGLIPVTSLIINEAEVSKDETVTYQGIPLSDITAVGYIVDYKEFEKKVKISLFDFTGLIDIHFLNKNEAEDTFGLSKLMYDGTKKPVQIFGTMKVHKNEKSILGAKIINVSSNSILYHRIDVIHSWLYLTGKLKELKENMVKNSAEEARMIAMGNNSYNTGYNNNAKNTPVKNKGDRDIQDAINLLENYAKKNNINISSGQMNALMKKFGKKAGDIISRLINNNKLIENDSGYEIII